MSDNEEDNDGRPLLMNAFEMITLSQGLNLSVLFDRRQVCPTNLYLMALAYHSFCILLVSGYIACDSIARIAYLAFAVILLFVMFDPLVYGDLTNLYFFLLVVPCFAKRFYIITKFSYLKSNYMHLCSLGSIIWRLKCHYFHELNQ